MDVKRANTAGQTGGDREGDQPVLERIDTRGGR